MRRKRLKDTRVSHPASVLITREQAVQVANKENFRGKLTAMEKEWANHKKGTNAWAQCVLTTKCGLDLWYHPRSQEFDLTDTSSSTEEKIRAYLGSLGS